MPTPTTPYIPAIPYGGNQAIVSSNRVTLHAQEDSVLIFGKKAIALSSLGTINLDITSKLIINSPKIELGLDAERLGDPVILGNKNVQLMMRLLESLEILGTSLQCMTETQLELAIPDIVFSAQKLSDTTAALRADLSSTLSKVTYTL
jgi:hypothetical protein